MKNRRKIIVGVILGAALILIVCGLLIFRNYLKNIQEHVAESVETKQPETIVIVESKEETESETETETVKETVSERLAYLDELYKQNPDVAGWLEIEGTELNYPVMFTPEDEEKYLRHDFDGNYSIGGVPFIDADCSLEPESDNIIIYGHNMNNGTMFRTLMSYAQESFWEEHPEILFATLEEERTYEVVAAFYDRVYFQYEDVFKFYQFIDADDEEHFNYAMENYKSKALYDTGVEAAYGDHLLTLVTCSYHTDYGRFVVVARAVSEEE